MNRAGSGAWALLLAVTGQSACWEVAELEDREATRCPSVFSRSVNPACAACLEASCCGELGRCADSLACRQCTIPSGQAYVCTRPREFSELASCVADACGPTCATGEFDELPAPYRDVFSSPSNGSCAHIGDVWGRMRCNPINNQPCNGLGEVCAIDWGTESWTCHATGHALRIGEACGLVEGECTTGHICVNGLCYRYCCPDADDCLPFGRCQPYSEDVPVGVCVID
jgi:hypothetical protein